MTKRLTISKKNLETSDCNTCTYRSKAPSSKILVSPVTGWLRLKKNGERLMIFIGSNYFIKATN